MAESVDVGAGGAGPVEIAAVNFTLSLEEKVRAMASGLPYHLVRLKRVESCLEDFWCRIAQAHHALREDVSSTKEFQQRWLEYVRTLDLKPIRKEVEDFNTNFPLEANLPMDPATGDFAFRGKHFERAEVPTREDVLRRFPGST